MYKVFINEKVIFFTNSNEIIKYSNFGLFFHFFDTNVAKIACNLLLNDNKQQCVIIKVDDVETAFKSFISGFKLIKAAGGVVKNNKNETLFIFRLGKWDLPKGKIEKNEETEQAAIREVEEECGISKLKIIKPLEDTYHIYELNDTLVLKQSSWFEMKTDDTSQLVPQIEENITDAQWFTNEDIKTKVLKNTYASIKEVLLNNTLKKPIL